MAKKTGLGANFYVAGYDLSNDVGTLNSATLERGLLEVTGMDKSAVERIPGLYTSSISFTGFFNDAALAEHVALSSLPTTDVEVSFFQSTTLGDIACGLTAKQVGYGWTRGTDGSLGITSEAQSNSDFLNWGQSLTAGKRTDSSATAAPSSVDFGTGSTAFGLVAYLHVFAFTGTSVTVSIEESSDDGAGDAFAAVTGGGFTAATGVTSERIETSLSQTVERYLRAPTAGTFSNAVFAVVAKRYAAANAER